MICRTLEDLVTAQQLVNGSEVLAYDTETTGLNTRKDVVIGFSVSNGLDGFYVPIRNGFKTHEFMPILSSLTGKKLVMWNATFDVLMTKNSLGVDLLPALHCDVMLLKHTCDENFPFGLKEVAKNILGVSSNEEKEELKAHLKAIGAGPKEYYKADISILGKYAVQDAVLTMRLFNHYNREARNRGLTDFYFTSEVHPLLKMVVIPMAERGIRVDVALLVSAQAEAATDLTALEADIQRQIEPLLGSIFVPWFLNKDYPVKTATGLQPKWAKDGLTQLGAFARDYPGQPLFNLSSKHHLKKLFFDTLGETPLNRTPTGLPQVDDEFITSMHGKYPWAVLLTDYNKLGKIKGTYIDKLLEEQEAGRFYPQWKVHGTVSGRLSGDMQQLPRPLEPGQASPLVIKHNNKIRQFIIADEGSQLCSADYEQLEPTIFAHCSGDPKLQAIFNSGADFYSTVAIDTEGLQNVSADKQAPNYLGKLDKSARQQAKAYALGIAYGMTGYKLQFELNVPQTDAEALVAKYLNAYPHLAAWIGSSKHDAAHKGYVTTQSGRRRNLQLAATLHNKYGDWLSNSLEIWKRYNAMPAMYERVKQDRKIYTNLLNNACNFQIQGLAASIMNRAAVKLAETLKTEQLKSYIAGQVHDELILNVPHNETERVAALTKQVMQDIVSLTVPLRTVPQFGATYRDCK